MRRSPFSPGQRGTVALGIMSIVMVIVILQLWLFTTTMEAYLGGDNGIAVPALLASAACLLLNLGLFYYLRYLEK